MLRATPVVRRTTDTHDPNDPNEFGLGHLFALTREAVVVASADQGHIVLWNPAAQRLFGWSATEAIGQQVDQLISPAITRLYQAGLDSDRPFELPATTHESAEVHLEVSLSTLEHPCSQERYILALMRDVTERRRAEHLAAERAQLESARELAEKTLEQQATVVRESVAHVRRQVRRLRRSTERLCSSLATERSARLGLRAGVVDARAACVGRELDRLATRSEIEARTLELQLVRVNLVPLMNDVIARTRARNPAHKLNAALPQGLTALVDAERVEEVVQLLLDNAIARTPRGCWIDVDLRRPLVGLARIEVRDFGRPASVETRRRLIEDADSDRDLALVRAIVGLHGGSLSFEFPADGGIRAIVTLPTQRGRVAASAA